MLTLLQRLLEVQLRHGVREGAVRVEGVELLEDALVLRLGVHAGGGAGGMLQGVLGKKVLNKGGQVTLRLEIVETAPGASRLRPHLGGGAAGRLLGLALDKLPGGWVNHLLRPLVGEAARLENGVLVLDHAALLRHLPRGG